MILVSSLKPPRFGLRAEQTSGVSKESRVILAPSRKLPRFGLRAAQTSGLPRLLHDPDALSKIPEV